MPARLFARQIFLRRVRLMAITHERVENGDRLLLIGHAVFDVRLLPRLKRRDVLRFVRDEIEMTDNADGRCLLRFSDAAKTKRDEADGEEIATTREHWRIITTAYNNCNVLSILPAHRDC